MQFATADYQEEVRTSATLGSDVKNSLRIDAFPSYPPLDFADDDEYQGFKIFPVGGMTGVSYFGFRGRTDRDGRPLLTADVALIEGSEIEPLRDPICIRDFLANSESHTNKSLSAFLESNPSVMSRKVFRRLVNTTDPAFLGDAVGNLLERGATTVVVTDKRQADPFFRLVYGILPPRFLRQLSVVSDCQSPGRDDTEDVVVSETESTSSSGLNPFGGTGTTGEIDLERRSAPDNRFGDLLADIYDELASGDEWFGLEWSDKHAILTEFVACRYAGEDCDIIETSNQLAAMEKTLQRARSIGGDQDSDGWFG